MPFLVVLVRESHHTDTNNCQNYDEIYALKPLRSPFATLLLPFIVDKLFISKLKLTSSVFFRLNVDQFSILITKRLSVVKCSNAMRYT